VNRPDGQRLEGTFPTRRLAGSCDGFSVFISAIVGEGVGHPRSYPSKKFEIFYDAIDAAFAVVLDFGERRRISACLGVS
jgi:hypothetical protein